MTDPRKLDARQLGIDAERRVASRLVAEGWQVLAKNWSGGGGELDLVVARAGCLRFVEVKARIDAAIAIEDALHAVKRSRISRAADAWLLAHPEPFEEIAVLLALVNCSSEPWEIVLIDDAFDGSP